MWSITKKKTLIFAVMIISVIVLTGCSTTLPATVEEFFEDNEQMREQLSDTLTGMENEDMTLQVDYAGNVITIHGITNASYSDDVIENMQKELLKGPLGKKDAFEEYITKIEETSKISDITFKVFIETADGKVILEKEYQNETY